MSRLGFPFNIPLRFWFNGSLYFGGSCTSFFLRLCFASVVFYFGGPPGISQIYHQRAPVQEPQREISSSVLYLNEVDRVRVRVLTSRPRRGGMKYLIQPAQGILQHPPPATSCSITSITVCVPDCWLDQFDQHVRISDYSINNPPEMQQPPRSGYPRVRVLR